MSSPGPSARSPRIMRGFVALGVPTDSPVALATATAAPQVSPTDAPIATATPPGAPPTPTPVYFSISYTCAYGQHLGLPGETTYTGYVCFDEPQIAGDIITYDLYICGSNTSTLSVNIGVPANGKVDAGYTHFDFTATCSPAAVRATGRVESNSTGAFLGAAGGFSFTVS